MPPDTKGRAVNLRLSEARLIYCIVITQYLAAFSFARLRNYGCCHIQFFTVFKNFVPLG